MRTSKHPPERFEARARWPKGMWDHEPDEASWSHAGLDCFLWRNPVGCWCGYVALPKAHPWHGKPYQELDAEVHGGLTYSNDACHAHVAELDGTRWFIGWDAGHYTDLIPAFRAEPAFRRIAELTGDKLHYWTFDAAITETQQLAEQAAKLTPAHNRVEPPAS